MTRKVVAKKTASTKSKRVVTKKSASKVPVRSPDTSKDEGSNDQAIVSKDASTTGKPKIHSKVIQFIASVGTDDRSRSYEDFVADIEKRIGALPHGKYVDAKGKRIPGVHLTLTGGHYILDGKVCLPEDYDKKTGTFKKGAVPPTWAGGPKENRETAPSNQEQMIRDARELSRDEYDKKYGIGKYRQLGTGGRVITPADQQRMAEERRRDKERSEDAALEEFDWDESDVTDDKKMGKIADRSASRAVKILKGKKPVKKVVKKPTKKAASKKVVRKVKK